MPPFRIEGKDAIRAHFAQLFQMYPSRRSFVRRPTTRVYIDDPVVQDAYTVRLLHRPAWPDDGVSYSAQHDLAKLGGRWQVVDSHVSRMPPP